MRPSRAVRAGVPLSAAVVATSLALALWLLPAPEVRAGASLSTFERVAGGIPVSADTMSVSGVVVEVHPLVQFLSAGLDVANLIDPSPIGIAEIEGLVPEPWSFSPDFPQQEQEWLERAEFLGGAYFKLGLDSEAREWLRAVERHTPDPTVKARVRRILVRSFATHADTTQLTALALSWTPQMVEAEGGRRAAVALLCGLHLVGKEDRVLDMCRRFKTLSGYGLFFRALYMSEHRISGDARSTVDEFLAVAQHDKSGVYPASLKLSALLLAADIDWRVGMDGRAAREYERLSRFEQPYVRSWARFMMGAIAMFNTRYETARGHFNDLCGDAGGSMWHDVACTLEAHSQRMIELKIEGATP